MNNKLVEKCLLTNPECARWLFEGEDRDYLLRIQLRKAFPIIAEEIQNMELPTTKGVNIKFKANPELTMPTQKEIADTAIMAYQQAEQDTRKAILDLLIKDK